MSRSSRLHESRIPRHYSEFFDWTKFNLLMMQLSGLDRFGSGAACPAQGGLEVSLLSLIDTLSRTAWSLYAEQTPAGLSQAEGEQEEYTRMDHYLSDWRSCLAKLKAVHYFVADGFYPKIKVFNAFE